MTTEFPLDLAAMLSVASSAVLSFLLGELIALPVFARMRKVYARDTGGGGNAHTAALKGLLERGVIFLGLLMDYAVIIAAFGAFKLGTRWKAEESLVSNNYFLVGNLASLLIVLGGVLLQRTIILPLLVYWLR